ncbi:hypothetical protein [Leptothrix cholodnii]|uniref:hypothetical protein n=1 Tax=Leptothrix cholodnii TaxID=34029 RepID=UPI00123720F0|nr:hypothetical protein [Leptothrix cholodnii]
MAASWSAGRAGSTVDVAWNLAESDKSVVTGLRLTLRLVRARWEQASLWRDSALGQAPKSPGFLPQLRAWGRVPAVNNPVRD